LELNIFSGILQTMVLDYLRGNRRCLIYPTQCASFTLWRIRDLVDYSYDRWQWFPKELTRRSSQSSPMIRSAFQCLWYLSWLCVAVIHMNGSSVAGDAWIIAWILR